MTPPNEKPASSLLIDGDIILSDAEIAVMGLDEAPDGIGPSWQEIKQARAKLEPARLGVGWGFALANINRRARDVAGPAFLGLNPDGPADRRIGLLRLEKADGTLLTLIANYAMHGTVLGDQNKLISGDAPGIVANYGGETRCSPALYSRCGRKHGSDL